MEALEIIEARIHRHIATGRTASIYGAVPWRSNAERAEWEIVSNGFSFRRPDGTVFRNRYHATREDAQRQIWEWELAKTRDELEALTGAGAADYLEYIKVAPADAASYIDAMRAQERRLQKAIEGVGK